MAVAMERRPRIATDGGSEPTCSEEAVPPASSRARPSQPDPLCSSGSSRAVCQVAMLWKCDRFGFG